MCLAATRYVLYTIEYLSHTHNCWTSWRVVCQCLPYEHRHQTNRPVYCGTASASIHLDDERFRLVVNVCWNVLDWTFQWGFFLDSQWISIVFHCFGICPFSCFRSEFFILHERMLNANTGKRYGIWWMSSNEYQLDSHPISKQLISWAHSQNTHTLCHWLRKLPFPSNASRKLGSVRHNAFHTALKTVFDSASMQK